MTGRMFEKFKEYCKQNSTAKIKELTLFPSNDYDWRTNIKSIYGATLFDDILEVRTIKWTKDKSFLVRYIKKSLLPTDFSVLPIERNYIKNIRISDGKTTTEFF